MPHNVLSLSPKRLLCASQSRGPNAKAAQDHLINVFGKKLKDLTARTCRRYYLHDQERDDVLAETLQQLLNPDIARFASRRGEPENYFKGLVQNAARKIMAQRRIRRKAASRPDRQENAVSEEARFAANRIWPPIGQILPDKEAEVRDSAQYVLDHAPSRVRQALELCYWSGWSLRTVASHLGMSRFSLAREIQRFFAKIKMDLE